MTLTRKHLVILAAGGSAALLAGAFGFQHLGNMPPCELCLWQRWPHAAAVLIGAAAQLWARAAAVLALAGAAAAATTGAIGVYHTGVERGWWQGPDSCTTAPVSGQSADALFEQIMSAPLVRCDEVPWDMLGLSMASWNAIAAFGLAAVWLAAARRTA